MSCEREACVTVVTMDERYRTVRTVRSRSWRMGLAFIPIRLSGRVAGERRRRASTHLQWRDVPVIKTDVMIERVAETVSFISCDFKPVPLILTASQDSLLDTSEPRPIVSNLEACYPRIASSRVGTVLLSWWRIGMQMLGVPHRTSVFSFHLGSRGTTLIETGSDCGTYARLCHVCAESNPSPLLPGQVTVRRSQGAAYIV